MGNKVGWSAHNAAAFLLNETYLNSLNLMKVGQQLMKKQRVMTDHDCVTSNYILPVSMLLTTATTSCCDSTTDDATSQPAPTYLSQCLLQRQPASTYLPVSMLTTTFFFLLVQLVIWQFFMRGYWKCLSIGKQNDAKSFSATVWMAIYCMAVHFTQYWSIAMLRTNILQGSVTTWLKCNGKCNYCFTKTLLSLTVKKSWEQTSIGKVREESKVVYRQTRLVAAARI